MDMRSFAILSAKEKLVLSKSKQKTHHGEKE